jgi:hypothetical protein
MADIKVLCFNSDNFNLDELNAMTDNERFGLCYDNESFGITEIMTLSGFQSDFNHRHLDDTDYYIFFH